MLNTAKLRQEFEDRPVEVMAVLTGAVLAASKVLDTLASARSKNAYAKQVKRNTSRRTK